MAARFGSSAKRIVGAASGVTAKAQLFSSRSPERSASRPSRSSVLANWRAVDGFACAGASAAAPAAGGMSRVSPSAPVSDSVSAPEPPVTRNVTTLPAGTVTTLGAGSPAGTTAASGAAASLVRKTGGLPV